MQVFKKSNSNSGSSGRPRTAVELAPQGVLAASVPGPGQPPAYAFSALVPGAVAPGIAEPNLRAPEAVAAALRSALDQVAGKSRSVTLIVPDMAARVFVLDFDTLPAKAIEVVPVLRFRLRKMVPFDVEHAAVSYQPLAAQHDATRGAVKLLVTVMPGPVLAEYEAAVRAAGYEPGVVLPSSLASLAAVDSDEPVLAANLSAHSLTTSITHGNDLLLYRTIELPADDGGRIIEAQRSIDVAAAFYEDKLAARPQQLRYAGPVEARDFAHALSTSGLSLVEIAPTPSTGAFTAPGSIAFAGVTGALAGVA